MSTRNSSTTSKLIGYIFQLVFTDNSKMNNIRSVINRILTIIIVVIFLLAGFMKLSARLSYEQHLKIQREFHRFASVSPTQLFGYSPCPHNYRTLIGVTEMTCAILLLVGNRPLRRIANHILVLMMLGAFITHCALGDPVSKVVPCMVVSFLIAWRHYTTGIFISMEPEKQE